MKISIELLDGRILVGDEFILHSDIWISEMDGYKYAFLKVGEETICFARVKANEPFGEFYIDLMLELLSETDEQVDGMFEQDYFELREIPFLPPPKSVTQKETEVPLYIQEYLAKKN